MSNQPSAPRLLRLLLTLYSRSFRERFGDDALLQLEDDLNEAAGGSNVLARSLKCLLSFAYHGVADRLDYVTEGLRYGWWHDLRSAVRAAFRRPAFLCIAVVSLMIGMSSSTILYTVVDALLLQDIPGATGPDRIVEIGMISPRGNQMPWDLPTFRDVRTSVDLLEHAAMYEMGPVSLSDDNAAERLLALYVTSGYFRVLGLDLAQGRVFSEKVDDGLGEHPIAILSHASWQERFDGDPNILGREVRINREPHTIVGVTPADFRGHRFGLQPSVYIPLTQFPPARASPEAFWEERNTHWGDVIGRLEPHASREQLNQSLSSVMTAVAEEHPDAKEGWGARALQATMAPADARGPLTIGLGLVGTLMALVLAATCANVGGMLLARAAAREQEMAVRMALGSGRGRLVRHLTTEAMVVFVLGGVGGVFVALWGLRWFDINRFLPTPFPTVLTFNLDWRVPAFGLLLAGGTGLLFGMLPALHATRSGVNLAIRDHANGNGLRASRLRRWFVGGQVGVSTLLLISAGLFVRSVQAGLDVEPGFNPESVWVTDLDLQMEGYATVEQAAAFTNQLRDLLVSRSEVVNVTVASDLPLDGGTSSAPTWPGGREANPDGMVPVTFGAVSEGYFETLEIPLLQGRTVTSADRWDTEAVVVINRSYSEAAWPDQDPLGRTLEFGSTAYTVIGVVRDTKSDLITDNPAPQIFLSAAQGYWPEVHVAARLVGNPADGAAILRSAILQADPLLALSVPRRLESLAGLGILPHRIAAVVASSLGALALLLSAIGVYGVVAFAVSRRTREIGIRIALGAGRNGILGMVLYNGLRLALPGFVVGSGLAVALGYGLRALLLGVSPVDGWGVVGASLLFGLVTTLASLAPALRASTVQPMEALRHD